MNEDQEQGIPFSGDPRVDAAINRIRGKFQDLEDAMLVQVHLEKRMSANILEQANWLESHEKTKQEHEDWLKHIQSKLDALTDIVMRKEGGAEVR